MSADQLRDSSFQVVIAGGGVAALEATLALRDLAGDLVEVTLVAPTDRFTFAPASVGAPFGKSVTRQFDLFRIANDLGVRLVVAAVAAAEPDVRRVILGDGRALTYGALMIACGASAREAVPALEDPPARTTVGGPSPSNPTDVAALAAWRVVGLDGVVVPSAGWA